MGCVITNMLKCNDQTQRDANQKTDISTIILIRYMGVNISLVRMVARVIESRRIVPGLNLIINIKTIII